MDACLRVRTDMTVSMAASRQGTVKAEWKPHTSDSFWLNIPVLKNIILSQRPSSIDVCDTCAPKRTTSKWAEPVLQKWPFRHSKHPKQTKSTEYTSNFDVPSQTYFSSCLLHPKWKNFLLPLAQGKILTLLWPHFHKPHSPSISKSYRR